jgi:hypothetical protein
VEFRLITGYNSREEKPSYIHGHAPLYCVADGEHAGSVHHDVSKVPKDASGIQIDKESRHQYPLTGAKHGNIYQTIDLLGLIRGEAGKCGY